MQSVSRILFAVCVVLLAMQAADEARSEADSALKPVTPQRLLSGTAESRDWLMYGGNYDNTRFSPLTDIDRSNVKKLSPAWSSRPGFPTSFRPRRLWPTG